MHEQRGCFTFILVDSFIFLHIPIFCRINFINIYVMYNDDDWMCVGVFFSRSKFIVNYYSRGKRRQLFHVHFITKACMMNKYLSMNRLEVA